MQLMTQEIEKKLEDVGYYPKVDDWDEAEVIVKYFNPYGAGTWLIVGGEKRGISKSILKSLLVHTNLFMNKIQDSSNFPNSTE